MRSSPLPDPVVMSRRQLAGAIGHGSLAIDRFVALCEKAESVGDDELMAYAWQRLVWARERLEECRAEWDRRGYVMRTKAPPVVPGRVRGPVE